jgi:hypothetical protein
VLLGFAFSSSAVPSEHETLVIIIAVAKTKKDAFIAAVYRAEQRTSTAAVKRSKILDASEWKPAAIKEEQILLLRSLHPGGVRRPRKSVVLISAG